MNGVHNLGKPQSWLFPVFPWTGFAFAGLAVGFLLLSNWVRQQEASCLRTGGPERNWPDHTWHDGWITARSGVCRLRLLAHKSKFLPDSRWAAAWRFSGAAYLWCRWGAGQWGFSPLAQVGQTSLLVYWVHIEFVYGRLSILPKHAQSIRTASFGLLAICVAMLMLSLVRTQLKGRGADVSEMVATPGQAGGDGKDTQSP